MKKSWFCFSSRTYTNPVYPNDVSLSENVHLHSRRWMALPQTSLLHHAAAQTCMVGWKPFLFLFGCDVTRPYVVFRWRVGKAVMAAPMRITANDKFPLLLNIRQNLTKLFVASKFYTYTLPFWAWLYLGWTFPLRYHVISWSFMTLLPQLVDFQFCMGLTLQIKILLSSSLPLIPLYAGEALQIEPYYLK